MDVRHIKGPVEEKKSGRPGYLERAGRETSCFLFHGGPSDAVFEYD
jgi:hypothetical protein